MKPFMADCDIDSGPFPFGLDSHYIIDVGRQFDRLGESSIDVCVTRSLIDEVERGFSCKFYRSIYCCSSLGISGSPE